MRLFKKRFACFCTFIAIFPNQLLADPCFKQNPLALSTASASAYSNFWERKGTVTAESRRFVNLASTLLQNAGSRGKSRVYQFQLEPTKYLGQYDEVALCELNLQKTLLQPLRFGKTVFESQDDIVDWFGKFSRGSGELGKRLYSLCPGKCSPRYTLLISNEKGKLAVDTSVVCGHARDKGQNTYELSLKESRRC